MLNEATNEEIHVHEAKVAVHEVFEQHRGNLYTFQHAEIGPYLLEQQQLALHIANEKGALAKYGLDQKPMPLTLNWHGWKANLNRVVQWDQLLNEGTCEWGRRSWALTISRFCSKGRGVAPAVAGQEPRFV